MGVFEHILYTEIADRQWQYYTADALAALTTRLFKWSGAESFELPLYSELYDKKQTKPMTAQEVYDHVLHLMEK